MNYEKTLKWLFSRLPMYQKMGNKALKKDLRNITLLCEKRGNPQNQFPVIHVAGTNGKGSCCHLLASVFMESGYKVGLLTSPHLKSFRERIRVNGKLCQKSFITEFVTENKHWIKDLNASFFEVTTAMGFEYFAQERVDIAVIETGMGGKLDSTNIVKPILSVITNISKDHTHLLGDTLSEIAQEKAGIIKPQTPVVIGERNLQTQNVFEQKARENQSEIYFVDDFDWEDIPSALQGEYQKSNKKTCQQVIQILKNEWKISQEHLQKGFRNVLQNTDLVGRWQVLRKNPLTIADTAHNLAGVQLVVKQLEKLRYNQLHLVLGFVKDKDVSMILKHFPQDAKYYFTEPNIPRKMPIEELKPLVMSHVSCEFFPKVKDAIQTAIKKAKKEDCIFIGGSTFVVAEAI